MSKVTSTSASIAQQLSDYYQKAVTGCNKVAPCTDDTCKRAIAKKHSANAAYIFTHYGNPMMPSSSTKPIMTKDLRKMLDKGKCTTHIIEFDPRPDPDPNVDPMHSDIKPTISTTQTPDYVYFGFEVFEGILADRPDSFTFKYIFTDGKPDVCFSVQFPGTIDKYYSLSNIMERMPLPKPGPSSTSKAASLPCEDPIYRRNVALAHNILEDDFTQCLNRFWVGRPIPSPSVYVRAAIEPLMDKKSCEEYAALLKWDKQDFLTNDITFNVALDPQMKRFQINETTHYSLEVFYGIFGMDGFEFRMYKGMDSSFRPTILMDVIDLTGTHRFYNLTHDRP